MKLLLYVLGWVSVKLFSMLQYYIITIRPTH